MPASKPSLAVLEKRLRVCVMRPSTVIKSRPLSDAGVVWTDGQSAIIAVDPFEAGILPTVLHELLHHEMRTDCERFGAAEEEVVLGLERAMHKYVNKSAKRREWWRATLAAKMETED